jgi:uncharacterized protein YbjQ (UPF0145 family)
LKHIIFIHFLFINILIANEIHVSENFQEHYCKEIKYVSASGTSNDKEELIKPLKEEAKKLGANSLIKVKYDYSGLLDSDYSVEGIIAHCDIAKSPAFFIKSPSLNSPEVKTNNQVVNYSTYVGINYGYSNFKFNITQTGSQTTSKDYSMNPDSFGFTVGKYIEDKRLALQYTHFNIGSNGNASIIDISYDKFFDKIKIHPKAKFYAGGTLSLITFEVKDLAKDGYSKDSIDVSGLQVSFNVGSIIALNKKSEVELGLKQSIFTNNQDSISNGTTSINMEIDSVTQLYLGYHFKF